MRRTRVLRKLLALNLLAPVEQDVERLLDVASEALACKASDWRCYDTVWSISN